MNKTKPGVHSIPGGKETELGSVEPEGEGAEQLEDKANYEKISVNAALDKQHRQVGPRLTVSVSFLLGLSEPRVLFCSLCIRSHVV